MKAWIAGAAGPELADVATPSPKPDEMLVRVMASG